MNRYKYFYILYTFKKVFNVSHSIFLTIFITIVPIYLFLSEPVFLQNHRNNFTPNLLLQIKVP